MRIPHHLTRSPSGLWSFRQRVPADLQAVLGRRIFKSTLRTCELAQARLAVLALAARYAHAFALLREQEMEKKEAEALIAGLQGKPQRGFTIERDARGNLRIQAEPGADTKAALTTLESIGRMSPDFFASPAMPFTFAALPCDMLRVNSNMESAIEMDFARHALMLLHAVVLTACTGTVQNTVAQVTPSGASAIRTGEPGTSAPADSFVNHDAATLHATSQEKLAMTTTKGSAAPNPTLSAEDVGQRFLKLLANVESKSDITVGRVQEIMGLTLDSDPIYPSYSQSLGNGWFYSVRYAIEMPGESWGVELEFKNDADPFPQQFPFCNPNYDDYHKALIRMGYRDRRGSNGTFPGTSQYDKKNFYVQVVPDIKQSPDGKAYPACVRKIGIFVPNDIPGHP